MSAQYSSGRARVRDVLWRPGAHPLEVVGEVAEAVLRAPAGSYTALDIDQASYLLTTFRRVLPQQYVAGEVGAGGAPPPLTS